MIISHTKYDNGTTDIDLTPENVAEASTLNKLVRTAKSKVELTIHTDLSATIRLFNDQRKNAFLCRVIGRTK